jgi:tRNA(fMet)-specific endonuclease VapC
MIKYLLDTDTSSYIIKKRTPDIELKLMNVGLERVAISVHTAAELLLGLEMAGAPAKLKKEISGFFHIVQIADYDYDAAELFAKISAYLHKAGRQIGIMDTQIAAHALSLDAVLVTNNAKHFSRIEGLKLENWI